MRRRRQLLTNEFTPGSSVTCEKAEKALQTINDRKGPNTVTALVNALPKIIQTHIATCRCHYSCLNLASALVEANQLQPLSQ